MHNQGFDSTTRTLEFYNPFDESAAVIPGRLPIEDLTGMAAAGKLVPAVFDAGQGSENTTGVWPRLLDQMARGLFRRRSRHLLLTGQPGVGKTTLLRELVRQATSGAIPFLAGKRFLRFDCQDVPAEESRCWKWLSITRV